MLPVRRSSEMLNMVCKELNLLWHVIPLTLIALVLLMGFTLLRYVTDSSASWLLSLWPQYGVGTVVVYGALVCIFAGLVPVGLERESGTHSWNLILPVSARRQWAVKLTTAIVVTLVCSALFSLLAALLLGPAFLGEVGHSPAGVRVAELRVLLVACVVLFWCAAASRTLMQATLWLIAFPSAIGLSLLGGRYLSRLVGELLAREPSWWMAYFLPDATRIWISSYTSNIEFHLVLLSPAFIVMVEQTYRLFRQEIRKPSHGARYLLSIAAIVFIAGFVIAAPEILRGRANMSASTLFAETARAVKAYGVDLEDLKQNGKLEIPAEALGKAGRVSLSAQKWLGDTTVVITPEKPSSAATRLLNHPSGYFITVRLWNKMECSFDEHPIHSGFFSCAKL